MQVKASQKQAKGEAEGNGTLLCVCFAMLVRKESCHMLRFALDCFVSLSFALLCFALHCITHLWTDKKTHQKHAKRHTASKPTAF